MADEQLAAQRAERLQRLLDDQGRMFMVPLDHGFTIGPVPGIHDIKGTLAAVAPHATCTTVHKGFVRTALEFKDQMGVIMHLSASTVYSIDQDDKRIVGTVEEAIALGADAVSVHINLGSTTENDQIEAVGRISTDCNRLGMPLIAMIYPRGAQIVDSHNADLIAQAARMGAELGADVVKVPYPGDPYSFKYAVRGAGIPVVVAGGAKDDDVDHFLAKVSGAAQGGASGVSAGRNVFQADDPGKMMESIVRCFEK